MSGPPMPWLRLYTDFIHSRKVARLPEAMQARLVKLWCLHQAGHLVGAATSDLAFELRMPEPEVIATLEVLTTAGFLEADGSPHDWGKHQFPSDNVTARTRKNRERSRERPGKQEAKRSGERSREHVEERRGEKSREEQSRAGAAPDGAPRERSSESRKKQNADVVAEATRLAQLLADLIRSRDAKARVAPARWALEIEKLNRLDARDWSEIECIIRFAQADRFWRGNILSGVKLRKQFDTLVAQTDRDRGDQRPAESRPARPVIDASADRLRHEGEMAAAAKGGAL